MSSAAPSGFPTPRRPGSRSRRWCCASPGAPASGERCGAPGRDRRRRPGRHERRRGARRRRGPGHAHREAQRARRASRLLPRRRHRRVDRQLPARPDALLHEPARLLRADRRAGQDPVPFRDSLHRRAGPRLAAALEPTPGAAALRALVSRPEVPLALRQAPHRPRARGPGGARTQRRGGGGALRLRAALARMGRRGGGVVLELGGGERLTADRVVVALPWHAAADVLPEEVPPQLRAALRDGFEPSPITGVHLWFGRAVTDLEFAALPGRQAQWFFDKTRNFGAEAGGGSYLQLVTSASRAWLDRAK